MFTQYIKDPSGCIRFSGPVEKLQKLSAGIYEVSQDGDGNMLLNTFEAHTDGIIELPNSPAELINGEVDTFLNEEVRNSFRRYGMLYKRGLLMYGPPGTGKTSIIHLLMQTAVRKNMIVLLGIYPGWVSNVVSTIRSIENNDRPIMVIWEEFENCTYRYEGELLNLLDGTNQLDNIFYVATTNYINKIPSRIRNRPSRFAEVIEIGAPDAALRRAFIEAKIHPEDKIDIDSWVRCTEGLAIDHIKDLIISVLVLKIPFKDAIQKLIQLNIDSGLFKVNVDNKNEPNTEIDSLGKFRATDLDTVAINFEACLPMPGDGQRKG